MSIKNGRHKIISFLIIWVHIIISANGQEVFNCSDTKYPKTDSSSLLHSKYHLLQIIGDASYMNSNYYEKDYNGIVAISENHIFFPRFSELYELALPDPYFVCIIKGIKDIDREKRSDYGLGIEWRPLKYDKTEGNILWQYLKHSRFYIEYLLTHYFIYMREWPHLPVDDFRLGIELYRECNIYSDNIIWSELWSDVSWRKTNFTIKDYSTLRFSIVPKIGIKIFGSSDFAVMPYFNSEFTISGKDLFWENRLIIGAGIRLMPFRFLDNRSFLILKSIRIYLEAAKVVKYFKSNAPPDTPSSNIRAGFTYSINRW